MTPWAALVAPAGLSIVSEDLALQQLKQSKTLAEKLRAGGVGAIDMVVSPAMGGVVVGYEMARQLSVPTANVHGHMDHVGGLLVEDVKKRLSPDVRIHVSATEVAFWRTELTTETGSVVPL